MAEGALTHLLVPGDEITHQNEDAHDFVLSNTGNVTP